MFVTIVICTFNRSRLLDKTLDQFRSLTVSCCTEWEILVVNNNCNDDTDEVIQRHSNHLPVRRLWEPRPGKSYAANLALREMKGDLILWTDDDVLVERGWLNAYVEAARRHTHVSFFGGPIIPWFETDPPAWLSRHLHSISACFAIRNSFEEPFVPIGASPLPFGANMATRRACFDENSFEVRLGPQGNAQIRGEETALLKTWLKRGLEGLWVQEARVQHFIPKARLTERYVWDFHCGAGRTQVRRGDLAPGKELFGVPRWVVRQYVENLVVSTLLSPTKNARWLGALTKAAICHGIIHELRESLT